jgi:hypothetical protein
MTKQSILNYLLITFFLVSCNNVEVINKKDVDQDSNISSVEYKQDTLSRWVGGFEESNALFSYPTPNLNSLHMLDNMANIDKLQRQQKAFWPEFSWKTNKNDEETRLYSRFSPDISRIGYNDKGRVFSIICPQQGYYSPYFGTLNIEVTVTGNRGWVNESTKEMAADMSVLGKLWFSESSKNKDAFRLLKKLFEKENLPFPLSKKNAIVIKTHLPGNVNQPIFPLRKGQSKSFAIPKFAQHKDAAWNVANLSVEISSPVKTGNEIVDDFNELYLNFFNLTSGNFLKKGHILSWNIWFGKPENVNQKEWSDHAKKWRESIDTGHGGPTGEGVRPRYFDGKTFTAKDQEALEKKAIEEFIKKHF